MSWTKETVYNELGFERLVKAHEYVVWFDSLNVHLERIAAIMNETGLSVPVAANERADTDRTMERRAARALIESALNVVNFPAQDSLSRNAQLRDVDDEDIQF